MSSKQRSPFLAGCSALGLIAVAIGASTVAVAQERTTTSSPTPSTSPPQVSKSSEAALASLQIPPDYSRVRDAEVIVDGAPAYLVRFERNDGRNSGLGGEHFSAVVEPSGKLKGFTRMDLALREGTLPSQEEAQAIAMRFLSRHAPDLMQRLQVSFIAPHDEQVQAGGGSVTLTGMKVKMRNTADGRWFWVIVGADRQVMVFERDIVWANLQGRRTTELWLHDSWLAENRSRLNRRNA